MTSKPWMDNITMETLPNEDLKTVAELIGLSPTKILMCELAGIVISIPKNATLKAKVEYIKQHYDGSKKSRVELAQICNLSENYIFRIVKKR